MVRELVARSDYVAGSPAIQAMLDRNADLIARVGAAFHGVEELRCRVASEDEDVIVEVDGLQRFTDLYLEPGILGRYRPAELAELITQTVYAAADLVTSETGRIRGEQFLDEHDPDV